MRYLQGAAAAVIVLISALSAVTAYQVTRIPMGRGETARWTEIAWPYPRDGWPAGRAFRCASCGGDVELYVRPKIGFCNCDTGVADDDEVDRVADLDLISERFSARAAGRAVRVADLSGRARAYDLALAGGARHAAIGFALSHRCDLMVAVIQGEGAPPTLERAALEFLEAREMQRWMMAALGGR
jgi:hypothetical protein